MDRLRAHRPWQGIAAATLLAIILMLGDGAIVAAPPTIISVEGYLNEKNVDQLWNLIIDNLDHIVGLKIEVTDTGNNTGPSRPLNAIGEGSKFGEGGTLAIWKRDGDFEIVVKDGYQYGHGNYIIDGYFLVKSGGIHQGVVSCGLIPVDEARVVLSGARVRHMNLRPK
jgi:hypothetical protein